MPIQPKQQPPYYENLQQINVYKAILTQTGTQNPTQIIITNTFKTTPIWTRTGVGQYLMTIPGAFIGNVISPLTGNLKNPFSVMAVPLLTGDVEHPYYQLSSGSDDTVELAIYTNSQQLTFAELSTIAPDLSIYIDLFTQ